MTKLPKPLRAIYPDGGTPVETFEARSCDQFTAHPDGTLRVWRGFLPLILPTRAPEIEMPYYPIQAVGMTDEEINRAVAVALQLLAMPINRKARRARPKKVAKLDA